MTETVQTTPRVKTMGFAAAMKDFFGLLDGQTLQAFAIELKKLNEAERAFFRAGLEANGYVVTS